MNESEVNEAFPARFTVEYRWSLFGEQEFLSLGPILAVLKEVQLGRRRPGFVRKSGKPHTSGTGHYCKKS